MIFRYFDMILNNFFVIILRLFKVSLVFLYIADRIVVGINGLCFSMCLVIVIVLR